MSDEHLSQKLMYWGEEKGGIVNSIIELTEDYINPSGEGCEPISLYKDELDFDDEPIVFNKGTLIIEID